MDVEVEGSHCVAKNRKRARNNCVEFDTGNWLKGKRVCLFGTFTYYRRQSVVDVLRLCGADVYIHPCNKKYEISILGGEGKTEPPYIEERELHKVNLQLLYNRFEVTLPWYLQFKPDSPEAYIGRQKEVVSITNWLHAWNKPKAKPGIIIYGGTGSGKKSLIQATLHSQQFSELLDVCADSDATVEQTAKCSDSISAVCDSIQCVQASSFIRPSQNGKHALLVFNANSLNSASDTNALTRLLSRRTLPVVFIVSEPKLDKRCKLWSKLGTFCTTLYIQPLRSYSIVSILENVTREAGAQGLISREQLEELAESCGGDVRHAINSLECLLRFRGCSAASMQKQCVPDTVKENLEALTSPIGSVIKLQLLSLLNSDMRICIEAAIVANSEKCARHDKQLLNMDRMASALSDCDAFYPGSEYRSAISVLSASNHMTPIESPFTAAPTHVKVQDGALLRGVRTEKAVHSFSSMRLASAHSMQLELLSMLPKLLKHTRVNDWPVNPALLDTLSMKVDRQ